MEEILCLIVFTQQSTPPCLLYCSHIEFRFRTYAEAQEAVEKLKEVREEIVAKQLSLDVSAGELYIFIHSSPIRTGREHANLRAIPLMLLVPIHNSMFHLFAFGVCASIVDGPCCNARCR